MHDFVSKLGSDGVVREWFIEVGEGSSWGNVAPVQQMVQLEIGKIHYMSCEWYVVRTVHTCIHK